MDSIELSGKQYPIRFDFRAMKEFKALTGEDVLKGFDSGNTDNILILAFVGLKSGFFLINPSALEFPLTIEEVSRLVGLGDMKKILLVLKSQAGPIEGENPEPETPGEIRGTA